jgi:hypothetical protein
MYSPKVYRDLKKEPEVLLCKDCVYSRLPLHYHIFKTLCLWGDSMSSVAARMEASEMRCRKVLYTETSDRDNVVTGPTVTVFKNIYCNDERQERLVINSYGMAQCGKKGKLWSPKKKEDIFKLLKR